MRGRILKAFGRNAEVTTCTDESSCCICVDRELFDTVASHPAAQGRARVAGAGPRAAGLGGHRAARPHHAGGLRRHGRRGLRAAALGADQGRAARGVGGDPGGGAAAAAADAEEGPAGAVQG